MSVATWNGTVFRVGETGDGASCSNNLQPDEIELCRLSREVQLADLKLEFSDMVKKVQEVCQPRMIEREQRLIEAKKRKFQKSFTASVENVE